MDGQTEVFTIPPSLKRGDKWVNIQLRDFSCPGILLLLFSLNKTLNPVLCNKYIHFLVVVKSSAMSYSKILENSRCRESVSYTFNVTVKCPEVKIFKLHFIFIHELLQ